MAHVKNFKIKPIISLFLLILAIFAIITMLGKILIPFIIALILTYILHPFVEKIHKKLKLNLNVISALISVCVFLALISIPIFIIPAFVMQIKNIIATIPLILDFLNNHIFKTINIKYGTSISLDYNSIKNLITQNLDSIYNHVDVVSPIAKNSLTIIEIFIYLMLIPFVLFYTIINWYNIILFFKELIPKSHIIITIEFINDIDKMLSSYLRGQISVIFVLAIYYIIALNYIYLPGATLIGLITGILAFIPYLGISTGFAISIIMGIAHFTDLNHLLYIPIVFIIGHCLESWIITPFLIGSRIGLNPVMIIFALMIFGKLFGLVGVLLALPLATITTVLLRYLKIYYLNSNYYSEV